MSTLLIEILSYQFISNALLASIFASITCGIIGTYIVSKRIVFISGGITHASFGGIGIGYYLGMSPMLGAAIFAVLSAIVIEFFTKKTDVRQDSAIGILWSFGMAIGIVFIYLSPGYAPNLMSYLFGSILTVSGYDLWMMCIVTLMIGIFFFLFFRLVLYISFDEAYARTHHAPIALVNYMLISLVALTIVINIKVVGIILVISLLTIPQTIANSFTDHFGRMMAYAVFIAFLGSVSGLLLSYYISIPSGAAIILSLVMLFILSKLVLLLRQRTGLSGMSINKSTD